MQCLYCKKRLGLFASKKFQFCSELHEVAYHDEQSGVALRRILDPLFTAPVKPAPLRATPEQAPPEEDESETIPSPSAPAPAECTAYLEQPRPEPIPPDLAAADGPLEVEPSAAEVQFPSLSGGVLAFEFDSLTLDSPAPHSVIEPATESGNASPAEIEAVIEAETAAAIFDEPIASDLLHPRLEESRPAAGAEAGTPYSTSGIDPLPPGFGIPPAYAGLRMNADLGVSGAEDGLTPRLGTEVPLEILPSVQLPLSSGGVIAFRLGSTSLDFATQPATEMAAEERETTVPWRLHSKVEQAKLTAIADTGALHAAEIDSLPIEFGPFVVQSAPRMNESLGVSPGIKAGLAPLVSLFGDGPFPLDPTRWPPAFIALAAEDEPSLNFSLDPQLPLRYPLANIAIASEVFEAPAELAVSRWNVSAAARPERLALSEGLRQAENEPRCFSAALEATLEVRKRIAATPAALAHWELPLAAAAPLRIAAVRLEEDTRTEQFHWPQALPVLPLLVPAQSFRIQFAGTATAALMVPPFPTPAPAFSAMLRQEPIPSAFTCAPFGRHLLQPPSRTELRFVFAMPLGISSPRVLEDTRTDARTEQFCWPQATPALPGAPSPTSFRIQLAGTATPAMTLSSPLFPATLQQEPIPSVLAFEAIASDYAPLDRVLLHAPASLEPRGIALTGRFQQQEPIPSVLAFEAIASDYALLDRVLLHAPASLEPRGIALTGHFHQHEPIPAGLAFDTLVSDCAPLDRVLPQAQASLEPGGIALTRHFQQQEPIPPALALEAPVSDFTLLNRVLLQTPASLEPHGIGLANRRQRPKPTPSVWVPEAPVSDCALLGRVLVQTPASLEPRGIGLTTHRQRPEPIPSVLAFEAPVSGCVPLGRVLLQTPAFLDPRRIGLSHRLLGEGPISPALAFEAPASDCPPFDRVLWQTPASLELRGIGLTARRLRPQPRELSTPPRNPNNGVVRAAFSKAHPGPAQPPEPPGTWEFSVGSRLVVRASLILEEIRQMERQVQTPSLPAWAERLLRQGIFARITPAVHDTPREGFPALGVTGFQRFRAVAHIRIREPELRNSTPGDLPVPSTGLPWHGVRMVSDIRPGAMPVPLRPSLQTPNPR